MEKVKYHYYCNCYVDKNDEVVQCPECKWVEEQEKGEV